MYSPTLGRFMQTDPIGYGDGLNWYNYVGSDPVNWTDPSELKTAGCNDTKEICVAGKPPIDPCAGAEICVQGRKDHGVPSDISDPNAVFRARPEPNQVADNDIVFTAIKSRPQSGKKDDVGPCDALQRGLQKLGRYGVKLGGDVTSSGIVITGGGLVVAGGSAALLQPEGVVLGGLIAEGVANVTLGGGVITTVGALSMLFGGSGKEAVADLAGRVVSSKIPAGLGRDVVGNAVQGAVNALPFEFRTCK